MNLIELNEIMGGEIKLLDSVFLLMTHCLVIDRALLYLMVEKK